MDAPGLYASPKENAWNGSPKCPNYHSGPFFFDCRDGHPPKLTLLALEFRKKTNSFWFSNGCSDVVCVAEREHVEQNIRASRSRPAVGVLWRWGALSYQ